MSNERFLKYTFSLITTLTKNFCTEFKWKENTASSEFAAGCQKLPISPGAELSVSSQHSPTHSATALGKD
jgi:hypothetical protein